jgi:hypothetical protein
MGHLKGSSIGNAYVLPSGCCAPIHLKLIVPLQSAEHQKELKTSFPLLLLWASFRHVSPMSHLHLTALCVDKELDRVGCLTKR